MLRAWLGIAFVPLSLCISHYFYLFAKIVITLFFILIMFLVIMFIVYFDYMLSIVRLSSCSCISSYSAHSNVQWVSGQHCVSMVRSLLGSSSVMMPILGCNMTILVAIQISCIYIWSLIGGFIWNNAIGSCILLDVVLQYGCFAMNIKN